MVPVEIRADLCGEGGDLGQEGLDLLLGQGLTHLREVKREEIEQRDLSGEGLGRRDAHLDPGARIENAVDLLRDLRPHHVRDGDGAGSALAYEAKGVNRVPRLAG